MNNTHHILIRFREGKQHVVYNCTSWGREKDCDPYFFLEKDGLKSYIPINAVLFLGPSDSYYGERDNEEKG